MTVSEYLTTGNKYADVDRVSFSPSASVTATGSSSPISTDCGVARLTLDVTTATGDTLDIDIETREDSNDSWRVVGSFTQVTTSTGTQRKCFAGLDREVRATWTVTNVGPYDFTIEGELV